MLSLASFMLAGRAQAIGVIVALLGLSLFLPPLGLLSSAAVALVTLRLGGTEGLGNIAVAALLSATLGGLFVGEATAFVVYGAVLWLPVWVLAFVLRERVDLALTLEVGTALAGLVVLGIYLFVATPSELWGATLERMLSPLLENPPSGFDVEFMRERMAWISHYMTGIVSAGSLLGVVAALFLARWWQARLFNPGGFGLEYKALRGHKPLAYLALALLMIMLASVAQDVTVEATGNLLAVVLTFYVITGTAVLHGLFAGFSAKCFLLALLYGSLLVIPHMLLPVALVGVADVWLDLRRWVRKADKTDA